MMKRWLPWIGWLLSIGAISILLMSARWKLTFDPWYVKEWGRLGWDPSMLPRIAIVQLTCVVLYLTPRTAVLGAVLLTGYLGGAISQVHATPGTVPRSGSPVCGAIRLGGTLPAGGATSIAPPVPS